LKITESELTDAINVLSNAKHTIQNCEKLAAVYTVRDHMYPTKPIERGYSANSNIADDVVGLYGRSDFLVAISEKKPSEAWLLMDDLMNTLYAINPRLYDSVMRRI
jgi:hypothetical protein